MPKIKTHKLTLWIFLSPALILHRPYLCWPLFIGLIFIFIKKISADIRVCHISAYSSLMWAQKREFKPKYSIEPVMNDLMSVTHTPEFLKNTISPYLHDVSALFRRYTSKNSLFSLNWTKKGVFYPFSVGLAMINFIIVRRKLKFAKNTILMYVDDFSALFRQFISKNSLFSLNWAKKGAFGPNLALDL